MPLEQDVELLRAKLAALEAGEAEPEAPAPPERPVGVAAYWCAEYERIRGAKDLAFAVKDGAILARLAKQFLPPERLAWMIREFLHSEDEWLLSGGWSTSQLALRARGLSLQWVRTVQEPALRREKVELEQKLAAFARDPKVLQLVRKLEENAK